MCPRWATASTGTLGGEKDIKRKPVALRLLGDQVVFFRDANNKVWPYRTPAPTAGTFLSGGISSGKGNNEFKGFITCPYHGYTYDGTGQCVAALTDGPNSKLAPKLKARNYPTETHKGIVYIWMGQTEPRATTGGCARRVLRRHGIH